jgi:hypothetical protein
VYTEGIAWDIDTSYKCNNQKLLPMKLIRFGKTGEEKPGIAMTMFS